MTSANEAGNSYIKTTSVPFSVAGTDPQMVLNVATRTAKPGILAGAVADDMAALEASGGLEISPWVLAADIKRWLDFLDSDPVLREYAAENPVEWPEIRALMRRKAWGTYRYRWKGMYRERMGPFEWLRAGFALPFIPEYYSWLARYLLRLGLSYPRRIVRA